MKVQLTKQFDFEMAHNSRGRTKSGRKVVEMWYGDGFWRFEKDSLQ